MTSEPASVEVQWLTPSEVQSWVQVVRLMAKLPCAIDSQLRRNADLTMSEYQTLAILSAQTDHVMRMSELAELSSASLSMLSHLVKRLEQRGFIVRAVDPEDGRFTTASLTDDGLAKLVAAAPAHVALVRRLVVDVLSPERFRKLGQDAARIVQQIDALRQS
jgi:DNA-binding MarR family transcriptional regulator